MYTAEPYTKDKDKAELPYFYWSSYQQVISVLYPFLFFHSINQSVSNAQNAPIAAELCLSEKQASHNIRRCWLITVVYWQCAHGNRYKVQHTGKIAELRYSKRYSTRCRSKNENDAIFDCAADRWGDWWYQSLFAREWRMINQFRSSNRRSKWTAANASQSQAGYFADLIHHRGNDYGHGAFRWLYQQLNPATIVDRPG